MHNVEGRRIPAYFEALGLPNRVSNMESGRDGRRANGTLTEVDLEKLLVFLM